ncbi:hypothetical protein lerEdw1_018726 [Lerista edwardsae]|nr:hypothetical protein lerEdw1_018726 [Lerista edwardsae]
MAQQQYLAPSLTTVATALALVVLMVVAFTILPSPQPALSKETQLPSGFPTIDMGPQLKVVEKARTATMLCAASGNPDPEISWFKDFLPVDTATSNGRIKQLRSGGTPIRVWRLVESSIAGVHRSKGVTQREVFTVKYAVPLLHATEGSKILDYSDSVIL